MLKGNVTTLLNCYLRNEYARDISNLLFVIEMNIIFIYFQNNSAQTFGVTQSCPLLTDPEPKPGLVNCSTQTDERVVISRPAINVSHASTNLDHEIDLEGQSSSASNDDAEMTRLMENISIDGLDMERFVLSW